MSQEFQYKPAKDLGMSATKRIKSIERERSVFSSIWLWIWWSSAHLLMKLYFRFEVSGRNHLPKELPYILISNHQSHLDVIALMLAVPYRQRHKVFPLAAEDHFFTRTLFSIFCAYAINALPMPRKGGGMQAIESLKKRLVDQGCGFILFPEGTRSRDGELKPFRSGIGVLATGLDVPVVPCYLEGAYAAFPADAAFPKPKKVRLIIGEPKRFKETADAITAPKTISSELETQVRGLASAS